jgi:hypothetical protein
LRDTGVWSFASSSDLISGKNRIRASGNFERALLPVSKGMTPTVYPGNRKFCQQIPSAQMDRLPFFPADNVRPGF